MIINQNLLLLLFYGISAITLINTLGAIASRKFTFKYSRVAFFSFIVYLLIGFFGSKMFEVNIAICVAVLVGLYEATVGLWLSFKLNANIDITKEEKKMLIGVYSIILMLITSIIFATIGYALTYIL